MKYLSLFSGIEAASVAWEPLGWEPMAFAEIEPFPCAVLAERFPHVPNLGDVSKIDWSEFVEEHGRPAVLIGGSPCQSFSVAGLRKGMADPRGNLMLEYLRAVDETNPKWVIWENVPGVLSADGGRAFGTLLGALVELGYGFAYRVLDAQFYGVAQRRRRVFVVGCLGDWRGATAVLFEQNSLRWDSPSSREKRESLTTATDRRAYSIGFLPNQRSGAGLGIEREQCPTILTSGHAAVANFPVLNDQGGERMDVEDNPPVTLRAEQHGHQPVIVCMTSTLEHAEIGDNLSPTLTARNSKEPPIVSQPICIADDNAKAAVNCNLCGALKVGGSPPIVSKNQVVRRLTPMECERLQGFPDNWTGITYKGKPAPDSPRYKALGNSMAVPVIKWLGERIEMQS